MEFVESWSQEILSRSMRVQNLINDKHWLTVGHHKEFLLRSFLDQHLPSSVSCQPGFVVAIRPNHQKEVSREVDILLTDKSRELLWFDEGGIVISPPGAVMAQIHVKTEYDTSEIRDCFSGASTVNSICEVEAYESLPWSSAVFFAKSNVTKEEKWESLLRSALKPLNKIEQQSLDCLAILGGPIILKKILNEDGRQEIYYCGYDCSNLSLGIFLSVIYDRITDKTRDQRKPSAFEQMVSTASCTQLFRLRINDINPDE